MSAMASQITNVSIVYSTVCPGADQRKHQNSASRAFELMWPHLIIILWNWFLRSVIHNVQHRSHTRRYNGLVLGKPIIHFMLTHPIKIFDTVRGVFLWKIFKWILGTWKNIDEGSDQQPDVYVKMTCPVSPDPWWRHDVSTLAALLFICEGNPPVISRFPSQRACDAELWYLLCC